MEALVLLALVILGALAGSFANWAGYSLVFMRRAISPWMQPENGCPPRFWSDYVPILGWIGLAREQAFRGGPSWVRPLLVELLLAGLFPMLYLQVMREAAPHTSSVTVLQAPSPSAYPTTQKLWGASLSRYALQAGLLILMAIATLTDLDEKLIMDQLTVPGVLAGLTYVTVFPFSLLPDLMLMPPNGPGDAQLGVVWASAPYFPSSGWFGTTHESLFVALLFFWGWCFGLLNRRWRIRRGWCVAWRLFWRGIFRDRFTWFVVLPLAFVGPLAICAMWRSGGIHWLGLQSSLYGVALGGGLVWMVRIVSGAALGQEAMGFGDVTLMAMMGSMLGWQAAAAIFFLAPCVAVVAAVLNFVLHRDHEIPFGPYLCLAALFVMFNWGWLWSKPREMILDLGWILPAMFAFVLAALAFLLVLVRVAKNRFAR